MSLKRPSLFIRENFSNKLLDHDIHKIINLYKSNGFLDVAVRAEIITQKNNYINILYFINEGDKYQFKKIIINGNKILSNNEIISLFLKKINKEFDPQFISKSLLALKKKYLEKGRINIKIEKEITINGSEVFLKINIYEGEKYII